MPKGTIPKSDIEKKALELVIIEKATWEDATAFITERVAFQMRNLIRTLRKNFWGVFDVEKDPTTGRKKIWIPLTESFVDSVVKNIDLDTKDINFRSKHPKAIQLTSVVRSIVKNALDKMNFGEYLDEFEKTLAIDGTAVWKTIESKDKDGKCVKILPVDLLNIYIDPTSRSIQEAYRFTERSLMTQEEVKGMPGWINTEDVVATTGHNASDSNYGTANVTTSKFVDVWELWGKIPKNLITGKAADTKEEVDGHIIVSGLEKSGSEKVHLLETYNGLKPYEEAWYSRVPGRWYGKGVAEKLMMLQLWVNTVVNIRINRAYVSQLGIFKIRKGSGVTPQMLSRLASNGAVVVNNMDDLEQFAMQEASTASYKDEEVILNWARQNTSNYETVTGEMLPSTTATQTAIQSRSASSQFVLIKEQLGMFLQRWVKNHALPILISYLKPSTLVRMGLDSEALADFDSNLVNQELYQQLDSIAQAGLFVDPMQVEQERQRALAVLSASGKDRYVELLQQFNPTDYDVQVYVTNEEIDKGVLAQNLLQMFQVIPALPPGTIDPISIAKQIMDVMGLDGNFLKGNPQAMMGMSQPGIQPQALGAPAGPGANPTAYGPAKNMVDLATRGNTMEPSGIR